MWLHYCTIPFLHPYQKQKKAITGSFGSYCLGGCEGGGVTVLTPFALIADDAQHPFMCFLPLVYQHHGEFVLPRVVWL